MPRTARVAAVSAPIVMSADPVFAAIEAHREALSEFAAEMHYASTKRRNRHEISVAASKAYDEATTTLSVARITTVDGLRAFLAYFADLQAYGHETIASGCYAVEAWHLSDAMGTASAAMVRLLPADAPALVH